MPQTLSGKVFFVMIPLIIYECILLAGECIHMIIWLIPRVSMYYSEETGIIDQLKMIQDLNTFALNNGLMMNVIYSIPSILIFLYMIRRDIPLRRFRFDSSASSRSDWMMLIPLAAAFSLAGNLLLNIGDITSSSENFINASDLLRGGSVFVQIIGIGFILPLCEELVIRGLVYMRMRQYLQVNMAILLSALLFAIMHGNMIQGIYAFILGVILAWFYEKYGSILAPLLIHITANLTAMGCAAILNQFFAETYRDMFLLVGGMVFSVIAAMLTLVMSRRVHAKRIYAETV